MKKIDKNRLRAFYMLLAYVFLLWLSVVLFKLKTEDKKIVFGSTFMTMNNPYFNVLNENIRDTIEANGDILITRDPAQSQERQNAQITDMLNEGIDFLFVNAVDKSGIESALLECEKRGVPVILIDTDVDNRIGVISAIQSDNYEAGVLLAQDLIRKKPEGAKILIVENLIALSMIQRRQGFIDTIKDNQKYEIVEEIDGVSEIETVNHAVIDYIENNDKDFDVIFGLNDPTAIGAVAALREKSEKKVLIYGVDGSPDAKELIRQGLFTATVAQHPIYMGKEAAKAAYDYLNGKEIESDISINVDLINAGNLTRFDISKWQ
ncbi:periplasmic-binding protein domain protein [Lachnoanaerobaculum sp. MSX33]|uniref:sugar ABC transporter substrate-binding protein n=1 Tax=Lachnoanaerobaculum sp. MSX33 TaxID=936596 RepID=UPI0003DF833A|nr:sugar ABC transporter substrate-binding protein [Lachnoanaerobaculum sp. MSX33]ETO99342.1 periplasmic-binding protein domain protein [Lachnoanaerobaculum sp. MSX33]